MENREFDKPENKGVIKTMLWNIGDRIFTALKELVEKYEAILEEQKRKIAEEKAKRNLPSNDN